MGQPLLVAVARAEQAQADRDPALGGVGEDGAQATEVVRIDARQVMAAIGVLDPGQGARLGLRRQRVAIDAELAGQLEIGAEEQTDVVETVGRQRVEITPVVEGAVDQGAIVLAGPDADARRAIPGEQATGGTDHGEALLGHDGSSWSATGDRGG